MMLYPSNLIGLAGPCIAESASVCVCVCVCVCVFKIYNYDLSTLLLISLHSLDSKPFCNVQQFLTFNQLGGPLGGANISCSYDRVAIAYCSLVDLSLLPLNISIPIQYQV